MNFSQGAFVARYPVGEALLVGHDLQLAGGAIGPGVVGATEVVDVASLVIDQSVTTVLTHVVKALNVTFVRSRDENLLPTQDVSFEKPENAGGYEEYVSDPDKPVPHTPKIVLRRDDRYVVQDQRYAASRPDVLVFESSDLTEDITIVGELFAYLFVTTTGTDADFIVKLIDVYPTDARYEGPNPLRVKMGGFQFMVRGDIMRAKYRNSFEHPEAMKPGEVTRVRFDMQDVAHTFLAGHRIMVQIQSTWFPLANRNPQTFTKQYKAGADAYQKATHRVFMTPDHPSHLEMSVLKKPR